MDLYQLRDYCLAKPGVEETFPFDEHTLVFKVMGKMFALTGLDNPELSVNLKCDPQRSEELREQYPEVQPGYHMSKIHWNTVSFEGSLSNALLRELIDHSYELVVRSLPKRQQLLLQSLPPSS